MFKLNSKEDSETLTDLNGPTSCCVTKALIQKHTHAFAYNHNINTLAHSRIKGNNKKYRATIFNNPEFEICNT